jgi:AcrR family transcriptional regulator
VKDRRSQILDAAGEVLAATGYVGTSLKNVADACGILPGSLYHHFDSKEAIAVELLRRYHADLESIATDAQAKIETGGAGVGFDPVTALALAVARCALRHKAAVQISLYEPHTAASAELKTLAAWRSDLITEAMRELLRAAAAEGYLEPGIDTHVLAAQLCVTMLHIGMDRLHRETSADQVATLLCELLFRGLAASRPEPAALDDSAARRSADRAIATWSAPEDDEPDRVALIRSVARVEFARRGYEATTVRDIAAAAGVGAGGIYRVIESKKALLDSIMESFHTHLSIAYGEVVAAEAGAIEKLDALTWVNLNALDRFELEFHIQRAWLRTSPPDTSVQLVALKRRAWQLGNVLEDGRRDGEIRLGRVRMDRLTACVRDLVWLPQSVVDRIGKRAALGHARATLLRGAATRSG